MHNHFCKFFLISFFCLKNFSFVFSENESCGCKLKNGSYVDLSSVGLPDRPKFMISYIQNGTGLYLISYNPCYSFGQEIVNTSREDQEVACEQAAACAYAGLVSKEKAKLYALGIQNTAKCNEKEGHIEISYNVPDNHGSVKVHLECNDSDDHEVTLSKIENYDVEMTLTGRCACPDKCNANGPSPDKGHRLSTGSVIIIIFFTMIIAYTVLGVLYNFCNGAKGTELCPHIGFWTELPHLIADGFIFTCTCLTSRRQTGYADM